MWNDDAFFLGALIAIKIKLCIISHEDLPLWSLRGGSTRPEACLIWRKLINGPHGRTRHSPLMEKSSTRAPSGNKFKASSTPGRRIVFELVALALSAWALSNTGLLLTFVSMLIKASDSAVGPSISLSSLSGLRIAEKMDNCSCVGVTNTTYSSVHNIRYVNCRLEKRIRLGGR